MNDANKKLNTGIMQPYFFPYIGYWQLMNAVDNYVIYDDVNYIKNGWINRNRILIHNAPSYINLQLESASPNKKINEICLNTNGILIKKNLKTIELAYRKAPFFNSVYPLIKDIIEYEDNNLARYLVYQIRQVASFLDMNTKFYLSSDLKKNNELRGQDKVIEICKILDSSYYINAIGGRELYSKDVFKQNGIDLLFLETNKDMCEYHQYVEDFAPSLSIIDVMMFNSKERIKEMLGYYFLK